MSNPAQTEQLFPYVIHLKIVAYRHINRLANLHTSTNVLMKRSVGLLPLATYTYFWTIRIMVLILKGFRQASHVIITSCVSKYLHNHRQYSRTFEFQKAQHHATG